MPQPGDSITSSIRLVRELGVGGMGSVWIADHLSLQTQVVVKFMHAQLAGDPDSLARFSREAAAGANVKSPHVVQVYDHGIAADGAPFIVMEMLEGCDLGDHLEKKGPLRLSELEQVVTQTCKALTRAHERGIVHRDIKPQNIFLTNLGGGDIFVKVLDFGIAKASDLQNTIGSTTKTGAMMGTPSYMSPEQIIGAKTIDHRTDLWALGVVAFECVVGRKPFEATTLGGLALTICNEPLPVPSVLQPGLPPELDGWFLRVCARNLDERFASATEMADALRAIVAGKPDVALARPTERASVEPSPFALTNPQRASQTPTPPSRAGALSASRASSPSPVSGSTTLPISVDTDATLPPSPAKRAVSGPVVGLAAVIGLVILGVVALTRDRRPPEGPIAAAASAPKVDIAPSTAAPSTAPPTAPPAAPAAPPTGAPAAVPRTSPSTGPSSAPVASAPPPASPCPPRRHLGRPRARPLPRRARSPPRRKIRTRSTRATTRSSRVPAPVPSSPRSKATMFCSRRPLPRWPLLPLAPLLAAAAAGFTLAFAAPAHAQSDADRESAQVLFKQGNEARTKGDLAAAVAKYKVAYALVETPVIGIALGKTETELNLLVEARQTFLSVGRIPASPNESARAVTARAEAVALAAQLEPRIATVTLKLHGPAGAAPSLTIDSVAIPAVAVEAPRRLNPGDHVVVATVAGAKTETSFHVGVGETKEVAVEVPAAVASSAPMAPPVVAIPVVTPAPVASSHLRVPAYVALGVGGAGVVVTAVFGILAAGNRSNLDGECSAGRVCPSSAQGDINSLKSNAIVSDVGLGVAIAGVGVGGVLLLLSRGESSDSASAPKSAVRVSPWIGLGAAGMKGSF